MASETPPSSIDVAIVGQGLAGSALAWQLHRRGRTVCLIDADDPSSSSRIAAGLLTPITGKRLTIYPEWSRYHHSAREFYRQIETLTDTVFFQESPMVRVFSSEEERNLFEHKHNSNRNAQLCDHRMLPEFVDAPCGGFEMTNAGRLDTESYLSATRDWFRKRHSYQTVQLSLANDIDLGKQMIHIPRLNLSCQQLVFCQGFAATENPWFAGIPFDAAKGEILTLEVEDFSEARILHAGVWIVPEQKGTIRLGATYDRVHLDQRPTAAGRDELLTQFRKVMPNLQEGNVVDHRAAIRPILHGRQPRLGLHPRDHRLAFLNGLGSRGALLSPWLASHLAEVLVDGVTVNPQFDLNQKVDLSSCVV